MLVFLSSIVGDRTIIKSEINAYSQAPPAPDIITTAKVWRAALEICLHSSIVVFNCMIALAILLHDQMLKVQLY